MSRFFATGDTSDESTSSESEEDVQQKAPVKAPTRKQAFTLSSDEEEEVRVVQSQKDKRFEELRSHIKVIKNSTKIRDVSRVSEGFEALRKAYDKSKSVVLAEGVPGFYVRALAEMEDFVRELWEDKESKSKLNKLNAKALASLRQKIKKYIKEADFETSVEEFRKNPSQFEDEDEGGAPKGADETVPSDSEDEEEDEEEEEEEEVVRPKSPPPKERAISKPEAAEADESDDSAMWPSESESESSDEDLGPLEKLHHTMFLKKKGDTAKEESKREKRQRDKSKKDKDRIKESGGRAVEEGEDDWQQVQGRTKEPFRDLRKAFFPNGLDKVEQVDLLKKRGEVVATRGKKGTAPGELLEQLDFLLHVYREKKDFSVAIEAKLQQDIVLTILDSNSSADAVLKEDMWSRLLSQTEELWNFLTNHPKVALTHSVNELEENLLDPTKPYQVSGSVLTIIERLDDEYTKLLQSADSRSPVYVARLKDEAKVTELIRKAQDFISADAAVDRDSNLCRVYMRRIEHLYCKIDPRYLNLTGLVADGVTDDFAEVMTELTRHIYNYQGVDQGRIRTRSMLCHIYHHALHDRWFQARDLMLMSHLQESIQHSDVETQILYNRALAQLGMCAFRHGMIKDAHDALLDIQSSGRSKELLAQGLMASKDRSPEQEKIERRRLVPFHMHINLELMECVYLTSAMLLEIPYMALMENQGRRRMISKSFHHQLKVHEKMPLLGPPESMREHVVAASNAMREGNWKACRDYILAIKAWNLFINMDRVKQMLERKIQEETLRTYIFTYGDVYDTLSLLRLSKQFELPEATVHSIISKMIIKEELLASLDEPSHSVAIHHAQPTSLQSLTLQLSEKVSNLADQNEELMKLKHATPWNIGPMGVSRGQRSDALGSRRRMGANRQ